MRLHIKTYRIFLLALFAIVALIGCDQADEKFKSYSVGFSTPNVKVWVSAAYLDQRIGILGGTMQGAWGEASAINSVSDAPMPHEIYVSWEEDKTKLRYEAKVKLVDDLAKRARKLPPVKFNVSQTVVKRIYIIIGMAADGKVTVWLSNTAYATGMTGRTLEVIGEAQGTLTKDVPPYYPSSKSKH